MDLVAGSMVGLSSCRDGRYVLDAGLRRNDPRHRGAGVQTWAELWAAHGHQLSRRQWQSRIGSNGGFDPWEELERRTGVRLDPALNESRRVRRDEFAGPAPGPAGDPGVARTSIQARVPGGRGVVVFPGLGGIPPAPTRDPRVFSHPRVCRRCGASQTRSDVLSNRLQGAGSPSHKFGGGGRLPARRRGRHGRRPVHRGRPSHAHRRSGFLAR